MALPRKRPRSALVRQVRPIRRVRRVLSASLMLRATLNAVPDMLWLKDGRGVYLACNPAFARYFGQPESRIVGRTDFDFVSAEEARAFREHDRRAVLAGGPTSLEEWITLADGTRLLLETTKTPMYDHARRFVGVLGVARDITARWEAQQRVSAEQDRFRALSEASFESIFISERGRCLEQNQAARDTFGYSDSEAVGRMGTDWIAPQDRARVLQNMMDGYEKPYEVLALRKDSSTFPALLRGKMAHYQGRSVRVTTLLDISELKETEDALRRQTTLLTRFYNMPLIGMSITDPATQRWLMVNDRLCQMLGYSRDELVRLRWSDLTHPDDVAEGRRQIAAIANGQQQSYSRELRVLRKDGSVLHIGIHVYGTQREDGTLEHIVSAVQDITERKEHEQALRIAATAFESQEGMYITDARAIILRVNGRLHPHHGLYRHRGRRAHPGHVSFGSACW